MLFLCLKDKPEKVDYECKKAKGCTEEKWHFVDG